MEQDIRWEQRFSNYVKALSKLEQAVVQITTTFDSDTLQLGEWLDEMIKEALIQRFEYTHELAWNVMKDYAHFQGNSEVAGSRDATREAFQLHLITEAHTWMDMIASRNKSSHTYNEVTANEIYTKILMEYFPLFLDFKHKMEQKLD